MDKINWNEQFKIRPKLNASLKHEVIKEILVLTIKEKYSKELNNIICYTEYQVNKDKICDVYFENLRTNTKIFYEIQRDLTNDYINKTNEIYNKIGDWQLIKENSFSDNIKEIKNRLLEFYII